MTLQVKPFHAGFSMLTADILWVGKRTGLRTLRLTLHLQQGFQDLFHQGIELGPGQGKNNVYYIYFAVRILKKPKCQTKVVDFFYDFWVDMDKLEFHSKS